ncbi:cyclic nucleotide-binding-like protein [Blakeslea trispora]|nr:cyclic nucleotide-binding-like protein [Blakeslea trispora]
MPVKTGERDFEIGNLPEGLNVTESLGAPSHLNTTSLELKQDIGQFGLAGKIWQSTHKQQQQQEPFNILELGAGTGYVGIAIAQQLKKPCKVYITDLEQVVPLIQENVNLHHKPSTDSAEIVVDRLHWGNHDDAQRLLEKVKRFDLVVVSDCVYFPELFGMLLDTLLDVCDPLTQVVIGYKCRSLEKEVGFWQDYFGRFFEYQPVRKIEPAEEEGKEEEVGDFLGAEDQLFQQFTFSHADEYTQLLTELHEVYCNDHPEDVLQYCANFFNKKLEEQRLSFLRGQQSGETEHHPLAENGSIFEQEPTFMVSNLSHYSSDSSYDLNDEEEDDDFEDEEDEARDNFSTAPIHLSIPTNYNRGRRTSVSAESMAPSSQSFTVKKVIAKTEEEVESIKVSIGSNFLFKNLDEEHHRDVVDAMVETPVKEGTAIIEQGGVGDYFYIVYSGSFDCFITKDERTTKVTSYEAGGSFGELALMYNAPRAATIVATSDAVLWALDRLTFRTILMENTSRKRKMYESFLEEVALLKSLEPYERHKIADALESVYFNDGEHIILQGDVGDQFYIIESGSAAFYKVDAQGDQQEVNQLERGSYFGELALLNDSPRAATVVAKGRLKCATLGKKAFTRLLGSVHEILKRNSENYHAFISQQQA